MSGLRLVWWVAATALAALAATVPAAPASAAQVEVFIEVSPNTIQAGFQVGIRASCGEDLNPATVRSGAFSQLTLTPNQSTRLLTGSVTVPATTRPGEYRVELRCADGATASAELFVLDMARPTRGPSTGGGGTAAEGTGGAAGTATAVLLAAGGLTALGAGAGLLLRRRRPA